MPDFKQYDAGRIAMSFAGIQLLGPMSGTFVTAERTEDTFSMDAGAAGDVTRVRNRNRTGTVTVTLKAESPANDLLSAKARQDEQFGTGHGPLFVKDLNGNTILHAERAWIRRPANVEYADEASGREWVFDCAELEMNVAGSVV